MTIPTVPSANVARMRDPREKERKEMLNRFRWLLLPAGLISLSVGAFVFMGATNGDDAEVHCVGHLENIPGEKASVLTERGCYDSFGEAVSVATNGRVQIPDVKSRPLTEAEVRSGLDRDMATLIDSTTIIGIDWKNSGFGGSSYLWEVSHLPGCADGTGWGSSGMPSGWSDTVGSAIGYSGCNNYLHWEHTWFTGASLNCYCSSMGVMNDATSSEQWSQ